MKSHRQLLALAAPLLVLQACAYHRSHSVAAQMTSTEVAIEQADTAVAGGNSPEALDKAKEKLMEAKVELDGESMGGDRRAMHLAKKAEGEAHYAAAHPQDGPRQDIGTPVPTPPPEATSYPAAAPAPAPVPVTP